MSNNPLFDIYIKEMSTKQTPISYLKGKDKDKEIDNFNELFFNAEKQKQAWRDKIVGFIRGLIVFQLIVFNLIIGFIIVSIIVNYTNFNKLSTSITSSLLNFLKYYISATIVELLGMLFFITQYSFSKIDENYFNSVKPKNKKERKNRR